MGFDYKKGEVHQELVLNKGANALMNQKNKATD